MIPYDKLREWVMSYMAKWHPIGSYDEVGEEDEQLGDVYALCRRVEAGTIEECLDNSEGCWRCARLVRKGMPVAKVVKR